MMAIGGIEAGGIIRWRGYRFRFRRIVGLAEEVSTWSDLKAARGVFSGGGLGIFFLSHFLSDLTSMIF